MTAVYCVFCRTTVDQVVVDFDVSQWAMCHPCHAKATTDVPAAASLFDEEGAP
jgi:hypothetical protein